MFHSKPPRRSSGLPYWDFLHLAPGERWKGWMAGPVVGVDCHYAGASKACRASITEGKLLCGFCASHMPAIWRGYVPLWDDGGVRCVVLIGERYASLARQIPLHAPVCVTKVKRQGCPLRVEAFNWTTAVPPISRADARPQDLRPWLLRLWSDQQLADWFAENPQTDLPVAMPSAPKCDAAPESSRLPKGKPALKVAPTDDADKPDDPATLKALLNRVMPNGKHKKE